MGLTTCTIQGWGDRTCDFTLTIEFVVSWRLYSDHQEQVSADVCSRMYTSTRCVRGSISSGVDPQKVLFIGGQYCAARVRHIAPVGVLLSRGAYPVL